MSGSTLRRARVKDLAIYIAISSAVILWVIIGFWRGLSFGWIVVWIATAFIFAGFAVVQRPLWSKPFWLFVVVCLLLHVALVMPRFVALVDQTTHGAAWLISIGGMVEFWLLIIGSNLVFSKRSRARSDFR